MKAIKKHIEAIIMHKFSAGSEEQKVAQLEKEEKGKLKMDIAPSSEREAGLNLQKKRKL